MSAIRKIPKPILFGVCGALGGLVGAMLLGEPFLAVALPPPVAGAAPSLVTRAAPPPPAEFKTRLDAAGAKTGAIQISLLWNNRNDLDLLCLDPNGELIFFNSKFSSTGGELDVDRNRDCENTTDGPIENIYWQKGRTPPTGEYKVYVVLFWNCEKQSRETPYKLNLLVGNDRREVAGSRITPISKPVTRERIFANAPAATFTVAPALKIYPERNGLAFQAGEPVKLAVDVERQFLRGPVRITAEGLPDGVTAEPVTVAGDSDRVEMVFRCERSSVAPKTITLRATADGLTATADVSLGKPSAWSPLSIALTAVWTMLVAAGLSTALVVVQSLYLGRSPFAGGRLPLVLAGAAAAGLVSGAVGQSLQYLCLAAGLPGVLGYVLGWLILGGLLGLGLSFFIPNLARLSAVVAGLLGGFIGVLAFLLGSQVHEAVGRLFGACILGGCIGAMVALVEAAFRKAWLEVKLGPRETITVNLGPEPVKIGSDAKNCTVWAKGAAPVALRYFVRNGQVVCHDVPTNTETIVNAGDTRGVGSLELTVKTGKGDAPKVRVNPEAPKPVAVVVPPPVPPAPVVPPLAAVAKPSAIDALFDPFPTAAPAKPKPAAPAFAKPPVPAMPKPPAPVAPSTASPPPPTVAAKCPECGETIQGKPGMRICKSCGAMS